MSAYTQQGPAEVGRTAKTECCGDPQNLDGGVHPWEYVGEDNGGMHYRCPECGAEDAD
jgi:hypothetical protein